MIAPSETACNVPDCFRWAAGRHWKEIAVLDIVNDVHAVQMVWHHNIEVKLDISTGYRHVLPFLSYDIAQVTQFHFTVVDSAEQFRFPICT